MKLLLVTLVALLCLPASAFAARDRTPPTVPTGLRVVAVTEDSVTLRWNASTDNSGKIHAYLVNGVYHPGTSTQKTIMAGSTHQGCSPARIGVSRSGNSTNECRR